MPLVNGRRFHHREWHTRLGLLLDKGLTVRAAAEKLGITENACLRAMKLSEGTDRPIGRSVRSRSAKPDPAA